MQISSESNSRLPAVSSSYPATNKTASSSGAQPSGNSLEAAGVKSADFTQMTRKELFDWMNTQITSGKMSLDESTPFLGMTLKMSVSTGQPVDMETDTDPINFIAKTREGIEGALVRGDGAEVNRLKSAIELMQRFQGTAFGIDARA
ncbi:hypothetical protein CMV30_04345 [Nibricoccus aquaticus]|uniref:Uncharacterized protein n=1 Tax=Nibricoccus aquaticus TaxID=2576891 RepID=A0A290QAI5_9BACT|nr:hypothetical protein [Nibricoccus aquaticus]ATC63246.1 hypothetical protein CMV30_04345 [Nibricoccus aquaticus]